MKDNQEQTLKLLDDEYRQLDYAQQRAQQTTDGTPKKLSRKELLKQKKQDWKTKKQKQKANKKNKNNKAQNKKSKPFTKALLKKLRLAINENSSSKFKTAYEHALINKYTLDKINLVKFFEKIADIGSPTTLESMKQLIELRDNNATGKNSKRRCEQM